MKSCNKISYETKRQAQKDALVIKANIAHHKTSVSKNRLRAYLCPNCDSWHLTSSKVLKHQKIYKLNKRVR